MGNDLEKKNRNSRDEVIKLINLMNSRKSKLDKTIITFAQTRNVNSQGFIITPIKKFEKYVVGSIIIRNMKQYIDILKFVDGKIDYVFIDNENKFDDLLTKAQLIIKKTLIYTLQTNDYSVDAADSIIIQSVNNLRDKNILIFGMGNIGSKIAIKLLERGASIHCFGVDINKLNTIIEGIKIISKSSKIDSYNDYRDINFNNVDIIIGSTPGIPIIDEYIIKKSIYCKLVIDVGIGTIKEDGIQFCVKNEIPIFRLDVRAGLISKIHLALETNFLLNKIMGTRKVGDITYVAGGVIGNHGDIILNNIEDLSSKVGISDGKGGIFYD